MIVISRPGTSGCPPSNYFVELGAENIPGQSGIVLVGTNPNLGIVAEDIWDAGGELEYPTAAETWEFVSDSANDTFGGTGAQTVTIPYLDDNYAQQSVTKNTNGLTSVTLNSDHLRPMPQNIKTDGVVLAGASQKNEGNITVRVAGGGATRTLIQASKGKTLDTHFTVPAGKQILIDELFIFIPKNEDVTVEPMVMIFGTNTWKSFSEVSAYQQPFANKLGVYPSLPEKTDFKMIGYSLNAAQRVAAGAAFILRDV